MSELSDTTVTAPAVLRNGPFDRIRRNHGLEHATIHLLSARHRGIGMAGRSDTRGFILIGDLPTEAVEKAVNEALERMSKGETQLAVHPNCGTNFVTAGALGALAAMAAMWGVGPRIWHKLERLPVVIGMVTLAMIVAQPLGIELQRNVTTSGDVGDMRVVSIKRKMRGNMVTHRVDTAG